MRPFTFSVLILVFNYVAFAGDAPDKATQRLEDASQRMQIACRFNPACLKQWKDNGAYNPGQDLKAAEERQRKLDAATDNQE